MAIVVQQREARHVQGRLKRLCAIWPDLHQVAVRPLDAATDLWMVVSRQGEDGPVDIDEELGWQPPPSGSGSTATGPTACPCPRPNGPGKGGVVAALGGRPGCWRKEECIAPHHADQPRGVKRRPDHIFPRPDLTEDAL